MTTTTTTSTTTTNTTNAATDDDNNTYTYANAVCTYTTNSTTSADWPKLPQCLAFIGQNPIWK